MYQKSVLFGIVTVMAVSTAAIAVTATETFDTGLGKFDLVVNVPGGDNDFGFSNTSYAGGDAGELGGTIARSDVARYVADGTLGGTLTTNDEIKMSGQFKLNNINFNGRFFFGYFNTANIADFERPSPGLGLWFYEPGGGSGDSFRLRICAGGEATGTGDPPHAPQNLVVNFNLTLTPSGNNDGSGSISANINGAEVTVNVRANEDVYNAFGLVVGFVGSSRPDKVTAYFDNLKYTVFAIEGNAFSPSPADGRIDVPRDAILSWTPGEFADKHDV